MTTTTAHRILADLILDPEPLDLPALRRDIDKARAEFTDEELTPAEHAARLEALATLEAAVRHAMNTNIEIIEDNAGGLTIQNTATRAVANFGHKSQAVDSLKSILDGEDMSDWDLSEPECYIDDEEYLKHATGGGYRRWDESTVRGFVEA